MKIRPKAIDLFSGAGGLTEGLRQAGYNVVGAVEIDPLACDTYRLNHKRVKLWQTDICRLSGVAMLKSLDLRRGELDLMAACPPCQGFSSMRTRNGANRNRDSRNNLIFEVLRLVRSMRPKSIMLENVPGLRDNIRYTKFLSELRSLKYNVQDDILNTADYGVPQRRRRLVLLASIEGIPLFASKSSCQKTVGKAIRNLPPPDQSRDCLHNYTTNRSSKILKLISNIPLNGGSRMALGYNNQLSCHKKIDGFKDVYGRMAWNKIAPTITGGCINPSKGRFLHPQENRAITLREAALLQTFPKSYKFPLYKGRYAVALLIGNALPPEFIKRHAKALRNSIDSH